MYLVFCRTDATTAPEGHLYRNRYQDGKIPGKFEQATRQTFTTLDRALKYARGCAPGRDAFVLDLDPTGYGQMTTVGTMEQTMDNSERLAYARELGVDW